MVKCYYLDTSLLLKEYFEESGSQLIRQLFSDKVNIFFTSSITYAEIYCTFMRLKRDNFLTRDQLSDVVEAFERDWKKIAVIEFGRDVRKLVPHITAKVSLKGADAIHLVSAISMQEKGINFLFGTADKRLLNAGIDCGLTQLNMV